MLDTDEYSAISNYLVVPGTDTLFKVTSIEPDAVVHNIYGADKALSGGTLQLKSNEYPSFDEACSDVCLENVVIQGANMLLIPNTCLFSGVVEFVCAMENTKFV